MNIQPSFPSELRGFGIAGIVAMLVILFTGNIPVNNIILPVGAILVLVWVKISNTPWRGIGYIRLKNISKTICIGIIFGVFLKFFMKAIVMPLLGADPVNQAYHYLSGNPSLIPTTLWAMLVAGFAEETVFRGFMFERLRKLFGWSIYSKIFIILFTSILFGSAHYHNQGIPGVEQALVTGIVFGTVFAINNNIWLVMIAHSVFDLTAYAMIYWNKETDVAHLIFK